MFVVMNICNVNEYLLNVNEFYTGDSILYIHIYTRLTVTSTDKDQVFQPIQVPESIRGLYLTVLWGSISKGVIKTNKINNK